MSRWDDFSVCSSLAYWYRLSMALRYGNASPRGVRCRLVAACCPTPLIRACTKGTTLHDAEAAAESGSYMNVSLTFCFHCTNGEIIESTIVCVYVCVCERERVCVCVCVCVCVEGEALHQCWVAGKIRASKGELGRKKRYRAQP